MTPVLSLCIPTNGIIEWVFSVLDSIYSQNANPVDYEVIVTNNGSDQEFHKKMLEYAKSHENLIYQKTEAVMFHNQLEALKLASGEYLKFLNHRELMVDGALQGLIDYIRGCKQDKPVLYFSNGVLKQSFDCKSFDEYVLRLGRYASWTSGVGIWRVDYEQKRDSFRVDKISPHSCILFAVRDRDRYVIENMVFSKEITSDHSKKGKYDLFKAFAVEEITITHIDGDIKASTLKAVIKDYRMFVASLYADFCMLKKPCSYDLSGFDDACGIYFSKWSVLFIAFLMWIKRSIKK